MMTTRRTSVFDVLPDRENGGWRVSSNGRNVFRAQTKREAVSRGAERAASSARSSGMAILRIRDSQGRFLEQRNYSA